MRYMYAKFVYDRINSRRIKFVISIKDVGSIIYLLHNTTVSVIAYNVAAFINKDDYEFFFQLLNSV